MSGMPRVETSVGPVVAIQAAVVLATLVASTTASVAADWKTYQNDRFGFSVEVPQSFKAGEEPANNDGLVFTALDGQAEMRGYGHLFVDVKTLVEDARQTETFAAADHLKVTYRQLSPTSFTLSGLEGDTVVYMHAVTTCKGLAAAFFEARYPIAEKTVIDPLVARAARSLRGSNRCWAPG